MSFSAFNKCLILHPSCRPFMLVHVQIHGTRMVHIIRNMCQGSIQEFGNSEFGRGGGGSIQNSILKWHAWDISLSLCRLGVHQRREWGGGGGAYLCFLPDYEFLCSVLCLSQSQIDHKCFVSLIPKTITVKKATRNSSEDC